MSRSVEHFGRVATRVFWASLRLNRILHSADAVLVSTLSSGSGRGDGILGQRQPGHPSHAVFAESLEFTKIAIVNGRTQGQHRIRFAKSQGTTVPAASCSNLVRPKLARVSLCLRDWN